MSSSFEPLTQNVTFLMADGITQVSVAVSDIDSWFYYNTKICILYGSQLGACLIMFIVTAVLTKESKRSTPVYILNLLSLALGSLRALFLALYCVSPWTEFYAYFTLDFSGVPRSAYSTSIAGTVIPLLMTITVNSSLVLQAHVVTKLMNRRYIWMVSALSCVVLLLAVGFRFAEVVTNSMAIMSANNYFSQAWITTGALATETISIWFFSTIFTGKLIWTVHVRKQLGFRKWTNLQLLAAMGGCTMIIPCK
jgi:pheromone alpha factor receptor